MRVRIVMSKGLDSLDYFVSHICGIVNHEHKSINMYELKNDVRYKNVKKCLQALEYLQNHYSFEFCINDDEKTKCYGLMRYGGNIFYIKTQQEYDLLKEVLL